MYIKSIVIDGFKSYGKRTEINGFDQEFNAITGLNGTGKSNILDAICFVLGISNLSQVRAGNLQDLIFKSGQSGIVQASVSVTFDNNNPTQSPPGFEDFHEITITRQVSMGGKNKYLLNGSVVQNKRIHDLFCSVQLNVNNPHFLIMQGRITKVLNMKPHEILSMIEEAAGTRMYETKRQAAQKTIEKKDAKLQELDKILIEEINPKLKKLRDERAVYVEFQRMERDLERMLALYQAWQYYISKRNSANAQKALEQGKDKVQKIYDNIERNKETANEMNEQVEKMTSKLRKSSGGKLQELETELKEKEKAEAKASAAQKSIKEAIATEERKKKQLEKNVVDDEAALKAKQQELAKVKDMFEELKSNDAADEQALAASQKKYEAISVGIEVNDDGEAETLQAQLINSKQQLAQASTTIKQANMQLSHLQTQLKDKQKELGANASDYQKDKAKLDAMEKEVKTLDAQFSKVKYSEERMNELQKRRHTLHNEIRNLQEKIERFESHYHHANFQYRDPEPNFNKNSVSGVICRLIKLQKPETSLAIETVAGAKLYNVVVNSDATSKKLIQNGNLQNRTTFIPLNKIQGGTIDPRKVKYAQDLVGKENIETALSLLKYDQHLQPAMEFVFGSAFVTKDLNIARQITFNDQIRCRCVTLEGDVTDPSGTLSGGAAQKGPSVLRLLEEIKEYEEQLKVKNQELVQVEKEIHQMSSSQDRWYSLKQQLELRQHELSLLQQRLQQTTHHQQQEEINNIKQNIADLTEQIKQSKETETKNNSKIKDLELKMKDTKGYREKLLKNAEDEMKQLKKKADNSRKMWKQREQEYETLNLEISELSNGLVNTQQQITAAEENLVKLKEQQDGLDDEVVEKKDLLAQIQDQYKKEKANISEKNKEAQKLLHKKEQLLAQVSEFELEIKKQDHEIKKLQDDYKHHCSREKEYYNKVKNDEKNLKDAAELGDNEGKDLEKRIKTMQDRKEKLSRTINVNAKNMFVEEEKQYNQLLKRKTIVENDKRKIIMAMKDLDKKKEETLLLAWEQVSRDFGSIFGTLLPGSNAKLQPPSGQSVLQGLEVKIFLGGVWKESLSELSGGQRSLVALSLILAMLLFKPAPIYILDEVDAALDLSHTQNIGQMLKAHFRQSQFIIVSLKDGMFSNANVLFRTKFVDGLSTVTRTVNRSAR